MVRSNFTFVRLSDDGTRLRVNGESEAVGEIRELQVAVAAPKPVDASSLGADLAPVAEQLSATLSGPVSSPWAALISVKPGTFERGDLVVIAGGELRAPAQSGAEHSPERLELSTWVGCTTVLLESDAKP